MKKDERNCRSKGSQISNYDAGNVSTHVDRVVVVTRPVEVERPLLEDVTVPPGELGLVVIEIEVVPGPTDVRVPPGRVTTGRADVEVEVELPASISVALSRQVSFDPSKTWPFEQTRPLRGKHFA